MSEETRDPTLQAQFDLAIKLESIFIPHARKQRDDLYHDAQAPLGVAKSARFVHYTTADAALSIITSKRIWMRNALCMTDYREVQHGFDLLRKFFSNNSDTAAFKATMDGCCPGAAEDALNLFNQWWGDIQSQTYITSISEHDPGEDAHGRLSMWRAFGGNHSSKVALVFDIPWATSGGDVLHIVFSPVAYLTEAQNLTQIHTVMDNISTQQDFLRSVDRQMIVNWVFNMLLTGVTCLKHEGFQEEREWRAIYSPNRNMSPLMKSSTRAINGVPQIVYELPLDEQESPQLADLEFSRIFDRIIIGPTQFGGPMYLAFKDALEKAGIPTEADKQRIFLSGIPIRTQN